MKYFLLYIGLFAQLYIHAQGSSNVYTTADPFNYWRLSEGDSAFVFVDKAYIRAEPSLKSKLLDSLSTGTLVIIKSPGYNSSTIKGFEAPWHKITYKIDNQQKSGFIWIGLLALGRHVDANRNQYIHGFEKYIPETNDDPGYYICDIKLLDKSGNLISKYTFKPQLFDQRYTQSKLLTGMGLDGIQHIYRIMFSGEACGVPTNYYYTGWDGNRFIEMPMRYTVSDAGVFYYEEKMLFPSEHNIEPNVIYKEIEEGEVIDPDANDYKYKNKRKREKYRWDGQQFVTVSDR